MRMYGETSHDGTLEFLKDLDGLRKGVRGKPPFVQRGMTPAEKEYSPYYSSQVLPSVDLSESSDMLRGIYRALQLMVRENRVKMHPLEFRLEEAFDFLKLSSQTRRVINEELDFFNTSYCWNRRAEDSRLYVTYFHMLRVALTSLKIGRTLKLPVDLLRPLFIASALHDIGKVQVYSNPDYADKEYADYQKAMREHPTLAVLALGSSIDDLSLAVIERHHRFQRDSYPDSFETREGEDVNFLAQILSIADFYDSASTRANDRSKISFLRRFLGVKLPSQRAVRELLLKDKGEIPLTKGFVEGKRTMGEVINFLYNERVIGRGNVFNPFPKSLD